MGPVGIILAVGGVGTALTLLDSYSKNKMKKCKLDTEVMILQANQAFQYGDATGNYQLVQAVATIFRNYGCNAEAKELDKFLQSKGHSPLIAIVNTNVPMPQAPPGHITLMPGETWRAAAILGGLGCAVGLSAIREGVEKKGFKLVRVYSKNPWGPAWVVPDGFLECGRWIEATVTGSTRHEKKPSQVVRLERVS